MALCGPDVSALGNSVIVADVGHLPTGSARYTGVSAFQLDTQQRKEWDGTGWTIMSEPSQSWAPTFNSGVTIGNGSWTVGWYKRGDGFIDFKAEFMLGSTSSVSGSPILNAPIAAFGTGPGDVWNELGDSSAGLVFSAYAGVGSTSTFTAYVQVVSGTYAFTTAATSSVPFTWAVGDVYRAGGRYRMTTRYS